MTMIDRCETMTKEPTVEDLVTDIVDNLVAAMINARIYWAEHPRVKESIQNLTRLVRDSCRRTAAESITISLTRDFLVFQGRPLLGASLGASRLIQTLRDWKAGGIQLRETIREGDFSVLLHRFNGRRQADESFERLNAELSKGEIQSILLLPVYQVVSGDDSLAAASEIEVLQVPLEMYQSVVDMLQSITVTVSTGGRISFQPVEAQAEDMLRRLQADRVPGNDLVRCDQYDAFTFGHSVRVSLLALNFGRFLIDDYGLLIRLGTAALLHDVGKSKIPFELLHSKKPLSPEERTEVSKHAAFGAEILMDHHESDPMSVVAAFGHHCSCTGGGYPQTLHEHQTSLVTNIVSIVDKYEALTAARPYKSPMTPVRAYRVMVGMKKIIDQPLLRRFIEINGIFPRGQELRLSSNERARVEAQSADLLLPQVRVLTDREGNVLQEDDQRLVDLSAPEQAAGVYVLDPNPDQT